MHVTGAFGDDEKITVLFTLEPEKTTWITAAKRTTALTQVLRPHQRLTGFHGMAP